MGTRHTAEPLQSKIWQLDQDQSSPQGFLYNCSLCDEILVLSKPFINPRKIQLTFSNICPGCGFELDKTLKVQTSTLPSGRRFLTNQVCKDPEQLIEPGESFEARLSRGSTLLRDVRSDLPSGIELLDETLVLRFGQLVTLQGEASNALSHLLFRLDWIAMSCLLMGETFSTRIRDLGTLSVSGLMRRGRSCGFISAERSPITSSAVSSLKGSQAQLTSAMPGWRSYRILQLSTVIRMSRRRGKRSISSPRIFVPWPLLPSRET